MATPPLLRRDYPPATANCSNTVGLVFGGISGVIGYRKELEGQRRRALTLAAGTSVGALLGGTLLLVRPPGVFKAVVPALILLACALMAIRRTPAAHTQRDHTVAGT